MQCLIIDDEKHAIDIISGHIERTPHLELAFATTVASEGLAFLRSNQVDIMFLDIEMPEMTGIEVLKLLNQLSLEKQPYVMLTTAYSEYAVQSYEYNVVDYMMKPITYTRFLKSLNKVDNLYGISKKESDTEEDYFIVKTGVKGKMLKLNFRDIEFVEGLRNYLSISYQNRKIPVLYNLSDMEKKLPGSYFARIHRSYILNLKMIKGIEGNEVVLDNDKRIPIGLSYREDFFHSIDNKILKK
ncbi:MAG: LytTR family DNA-binding domain-containing protein [Cytophagales bacterium]|nr:LytTR family DNA-binding domain-containing protein [Cytophagales bacterium]